MGAEEVAKWLTFKVSENSQGIGRAFRYYDKDGSGAIDYDEFREFLSHRYNLHLNDYQFHRLMQECDPDRSGEVDYDEFLGFF